MFKNLTIRQISFSISFVIWMTHIVILVSIYAVSDVSNVQPGYFIVYAFATLLIGYFLLRFLFETFVFRKIKLIYKVITDSKDSLKDVKSLDSVETSLEDVNEKVVEWAAETEKEITSLKSLESYRKKYVGDISHELKTPIFTIQGYLYTLLEGGLYDEKINKKYLERAVSNLARLQTIVEDLELINQLESEAGLLDLTKFNIKELVEEVFRDLEMQAASKNINLIFKPGANQSFTVLADRNKMHQVFINLIKNSIKYGNDGGTTKVSFYDMDERILVEVSDNGIGVKEEDLKHLFDRFYRADKSRSRQVGGSGLGLAIVKHIMEAHKQKITVRSTFGLGSTFGITLQKAKITY
ncbi:MAG: sensor histidine kinase [Saprospiraceae bacterium]|nr:sensor histidine kinase [Saprospiraceae bacterium]